MFKEREITKVVVNVGPVELLSFAHRNFDLTHHLVGGAMYVECYSPPSGPGRSELYIFGPWNLTSQDDRKSFGEFLWYIEENMSALEPGLHNLSPKYRRLFMRSSLAATQSHCGWDRRHTHEMFRKPKFQDHN